MNLQENFVKTTHWLIPMLALALGTACGSSDGDDGRPPVDFDGGVPDGGDGPPDGGGETEHVRFAANFPGEAVSVWPPYTIARIDRVDSNTLPVLGFDGSVISDEHYVWDFWPIRAKDGSVAAIDGRAVIIALTAPRDGVVPGERHGLARWRYFYTDGGGWTAGGLVFPEGDPIGDRQWAGSAAYDAETGRVELFYTALGELEPLPDGSDSPTNAADGYEDARRTGPSLVRQQIVQTSATVVSDEGGIRFEGFAPHRVILDADGEFYATAEQARETGALYVFRDPWYFADPKTDREFLLFAAAAGFQTGPKSGVVGLAVFDEATNEWNQLPPVIAAMDTNSQLERPHVVVRDGRYFLFFSSHEFTFGNVDPGPEGLYGFWADHLWGHYTPINEGGLVLANPEAASLQTYSYTVLPSGVVTSFVNYFDLGPVTLSEIGDQTRAWQKEHFGGTPARPFFLDIDRTTTRLEVPAPTDLSLGDGERALVDALR